MHAVQSTAQVSQTLAQPTAAQANRPLQHTQPAAQQQDEQKRPSLQLEKGQGALIDALA